MNPLPPVTPRFGAVALRVETSHAKGLPLATAFVGDYTQQGYADGDLVVITPSLQVHRLVENNPVVARFTQAIRTAHGFEGPGKGPQGSHVKSLARSVFLELRRLFRTGVLPITSTPGSEDLYERLFERKRPERSNTAERILCDALGYDYLALSDSDTRVNRRHIFVDREGRAFHADPNRQPPSPRPTTEGAEGP